MMNEKWIKYSYVCPSCDSLIEYTAKAGYTPNVTQITCLCGGNAVQVSVEDATILPITEKKEDPMATATTTYMEEQVNELKAQLANHQNCDYWKSENGRVQGQLIELVNDAYESDKDAEEILTEICSIIDYEPKKEIEFTATITVTGRYDLPLEEANSFDLDAFLSDTLSVDAYNGDVIIDGFELESSEEC